LSRRREFSTAVKGQRFTLAGGRCEICGADLAGKRAEYDHRIADGAGGKPTLDNCVLTCKPCHQAKTSGHDVPLVAKIKRQSAVAAGARPAPKRPIRSAGFPASARRAVHPMPQLARRALFAETEG